MLFCFWIKLILLTGSLKLLFNVTMVENWKRTLPKKNIVFLILLGVIHLWRPQKMTTFLTPPYPHHLQKWTIDLLLKNNRIHKHVTNFKTPHPPSVWTSWMYDPLSKKDFSGSTKYKLHSFMGRITFHRIMNCYFIFGFGHSLEWCSAKLGLPQKAVL